MTDNKTKSTTPFRAAPLPRPARLPGITSRSCTVVAGNPDSIRPHHHRTDIVSDPQITCTNCGTEIKLTESLAAPIVAASRKQFEAQPAVPQGNLALAPDHPKACYAQPRNSRAANW
jgi:hypothetical protein